jgi:cytochrome d ubiquinol oxidase subunit II
MFDFSTVINLPFLWGILICVSILLYVVLDGFDLGVGVLFPFTPSEQCKVKILNSVAPFWDGNETWLVLGGGGLFAAFPLAYSIIMPALYLPVILMLLGLIFRGVAFEFRFKSPASQTKIWDVSFHGGSLLAAFMQGVILGNIVQGFDVEGRQFAGGSWDWASSFALLNGMALIFGYALLGSTWLIMKTDGETQHWARKVTPYLLSFVVLFVLIVAVSLPFVDSTGIRFKWISTPHIYLLIAIALFSICSVFLIYRGALNSAQEKSPFFLSCGVFLLGFIVLGVSLWPWIVPFQFTLEQAAASSTSLSLLLVGAVFCLPFVLGYTAYCYYVFRGKSSTKSLY